MQIRGGVEARAQLFGSHETRPATVFADPPSLTIADPLHSEEEERYVILGESTLGRLLAVVFAEREGTVRLISARKATPAERKAYENG